MIFRAAVSLTLISPLLFSQQNGGAPDLEAQAAALKGLVAKAPKSKLEGQQIAIQAPAAGFEIGYPSAVTMDRAGNIYVLHRGEKADPVLVLNRDGKVIRSWGKGLYKIPHSIRIDPDQNIWTVDSGSSMILKFSPQGEKLMEISVGEQPTGRGATNGTSDIAFGPNGRIYISDGYGNSRVLEYDKNGKRVRQWGSRGTGPGEFNQPHGIAIDDAGIIYVADRNNARLQRFDLDGKYLGEWNHLGKVTAVAFRDGALWIGSQLRNEPNEANGWQFKIDRKSGNILEYAVSERSHHVLNINGKGELLSGARPDIALWFHKAN
jgi:DNA-binding beta-propeller fold protein YncE